MKPTSSNRNSGYHRPAVRINSLPYQRTAPENDEIRLLEVFPSQDFDSMVECSMRHYSLIEDFVEYAALSYEWGNTSVRKRILVDGFRFSVTPNLYEFLRQMRRRRSPLLWIDQICINQKDDQEKSVYIPKMGKIFHRACYVYVWLGPSRDGSRELMAFLKELETEHRPVCAHNKKIPELDDDDLDVYRNELDAFMRRGYWRRVWIIQEIAMGTEVFVFCGPDKVSWKAIELLMGQLSKRTLFRGKQINQVEHLCITRTQKQQDNPISLLQAMYESRASLATNLRDRVYGLLSLVYDSDRYVDRPRYDASLTQICRSMTETVIRSKKSLDIMFAGPKHPGSMLDLPSWCPNYFIFPSSATVSHLAKYLSSQDVRHRVGQLSHRWEATGNSAATGRTFDFIGHGLAVLGIQIARINNLGCTLHDSQPLRRGSFTGERESLIDTSVFRTIDRVLSMYDRGYQPPCMETDARPKILHYLFNFDSMGQLSESKKKKLRDKHADVIEWRQLNGGFIINGKTLKTRSLISRSWAHSGRLLRAVVGSVVTNALLPNRDASRSFHNLDDVSEKFPPDLDSALTSLGDLIQEGMRLMTTYDADIGWAHPNAEIDDHIFLLAGCSMPAILRRSTRKGNAYIVIGYAYMDGVMSNEVWSTVEPSKKKMINIH